MSVVLFSVIKQTLLRESHVTNPGDGDNIASLYIVLGTFCVSKVITILLVDHIFQNTVRAFKSKMHKIKKT